MSNLKPLVLKNLSKKNFAHFNLDLDIIREQLTDQELCVRYNCTKAQLAGRRSSLVVRKHLAPKNSTKKLVKTLSGFAKMISEPVESVKPVRTGPKGIAPELKAEIILELKKGHKIDMISKALDVSISTVYRIKKGLTINKEVKELKVVAKDTNVSTNSYTNADGANKEIARNKMVKYIVDADRSGTVLSLPFSTCAIEKKILVDAPDTKFLGVELNSETYKELKRTVRAEKLPIETYEGKLSDKIYGEVNDTYSAIIADYCGGLGKFGREIEYAVKNNIVVRGGILALTFSKPIRGGKDAKELLKLGGTITNNVNDNRCKSDKAFEAFFNRICGNDYEFKEIFNYKDDKKDADAHGFPMVLIILKRK